MAHNVSLNSSPCFSTVVSVAEVEVVAVISAQHKHWSTKCVITAGIEHMITSLLTVSLALAPALAL
jgi:hypothetical protein